MYVLLIMKSLAKNIYSDQNKVLETFAVSF